MNETPGSLKAAFAVVLVALVAGVLLSGGDEVASVPNGNEERAFGAALADPVPYDGRSPALAQGRRERVLVELPRPALGELDDVATMSPRARRRYVVSLRDESRALLSALDARGVQTREVVTFERTWHGFAATVDAKDLPGLQSLGVRLRANRRFYPAFSEPVPLAAAGDVAVPPSGAPSVALLGAGSAARGYDAVERRSARTDRDDPLAAVLAAHDVNARLVRVAASRRATGLTGRETFARTDELLDGLEHAVDPDFDGDTSDHDRVALIGVNAPYAGFADAPEAKAADGARRLGTLVVAPGGDEGAGTDAFGTVGSPGAAAAALAVAPLSDPQAVARTTLKVGAVRVEGAAVLAGAPPRPGLRTSAPVDPPRLVEDGPPDLEGRLAVVRAGTNPGAQAAAAADGGAAAVLLAEPRDGRPLPTVPAGRVAVPVLGVTGAGARAILGLDAGAAVTAEPATAKAPARGRLGRFASRGPAFDGAAKPDLARQGTSAAGGRLVSGAGVAAATVAAEAAKLGTDPGEARRALLSATDAVRSGSAQSPPAPPPVPVGTPEVRRERDSTGVAFTVGTFDRGDPPAAGPTTIVPAARLVLTLRQAGGALVERLTPPGGERGVLPGEYAYTLTAKVLEDLAAGSYVFRVRAVAPRQTRPTVETSAPFEVS